MNNILYIVVCFYNEAEILDFVTSQVFNQTVSVDTIVINNGHSNIEIINKIDDLKNTKVLNNGTNLGYYGAASLALDNIDTDLYKFIIVGNSDITFNSKYFFETLLLKYSEAQVVGTIGPSIISGASFSDQNPFLTQRPSKFKYMKLNLMYSNIFFYYIYQTGANFYRTYLKKNKKIRKKRSQNTYALHGSFIIFTPEYFERGGDFKYGSFLFQEEIFVAEKCKELRLKSVYDPELSITHKEHETTGSYKNRKLLNYMYMSNKHTMKTYY